MPNNSTTKFKADISEFKAAFSEAQRTIKVLNSEFKAATAGMDKWSNNADGLSAKITQLNGKIDAEKKKLESLENQYAAVVAQEGENSKGAQELAIKINNQKAAVANCQSEIGKYESKLSELKASNAEADSAVGKLSATISEQESDLESLKNKYKNLVLAQGESSSEAQDTAAQISKLSTELNDNKAKMAAAESATEGLTASMDEAGEETQQLDGGFTILKGSIAGLIANGLTALASGIKNTISSIAGLAESTREYREDIGKLETAFSTAGFSTQAATDVYKDFYSVLGEEDRSVEAVNHLAKLCDNEKELSDWTTICTGVWGTFGDSLPIEGLTEAANETAKVGKVTGPLADALNWAGISEDKFNEQLAKCSSEQERQKLITQTLSKEYEGAAKAYEKANGSVMDANRANSDYADTLAALGEKMEPVMTTIKIGITEIMKGFAKMLEGVDMDAVVSKIQSGFSFVANEVIPVVVEGFKNLIYGVKTFIGWVKALSPVLVGLSVAIAGLAIAGLIQNFTKIAGAMKLWFTSTKLVTAAQWLLNAAMSANPIGLIVIAIAALVAAFIVLWNKSEAFRNFWIGLWEKVKEAASVAWEYIKNAFSAAWEYIKTTWDKAKPFFIAIWEGIKTIFSVVKTVLGGFFSAAWEAIKVVWNVVSGYFAAVWNGIKIIFSVVKTVLGGFFSAAWEAIKVVWNVVVNYFKMIWEGIKAVFSVVKAVLSGDFSGAWEAIKGIWNNVISYFRQIWDGIKAVFSVVASVLSGFFSDAWNGIKNIWNAVKGYFLDRFEDVKRPFVNIAGWFKEKFTAAYNKVVEAFNGWKTFFSDRLEDVKEYFNLENFKKIFKESIVDGLNGIIEDVGTAAKNVWEEMKKWFTKKFDLTFGFGGGEGGGGTGGGTLSPFNTARITSGFGVKRGNRRHKGVDFAAPMGTKIQSTTWGKVVRTPYEANGFGHYVVVQDMSGNLHYYGHMSKKSVVAGQRVARGSTLGKVGSTGRSTGPHLHYEVRVNGAAVNPEKWWKSARYGYYAKGGVVKKGHMAILEGSGAEAVVPLEKNTEWIEKVSDKVLQNINAGAVAGNAGHPVVSKNYNFYQTNNSPKALSRLDIYRQTKNQLNFAKGVT